MLKSFGRRHGFTLLPFNGTESHDTEITTETGQKEYQQQLEALVRKLYPQAKNVTFTSFLLRGEGSNPPATDGPHLDNHQDHAALQAFREEVAPATESQDIASGSQYQLMLGFWKPILMKSTVCDYPLAVMDAATFSSEHQVRFEQVFQHVEHGVQVAVKNLGNL